MLGLVNGMNAVNYKPLKNLTDSTGYLNLFSNWMDAVNSLVNGMDAVNYKQLKNLKAKKKITQFC